MTVPIVKRIGMLIKKIKAKRLEQGKSEMAKEIGKITNKIREDIQDQNQEIERGKVFIKV
jgi:hypothetical protein